SLQPFHHDGWLSQNILTCFVPQKALRMLKLHWSFTTLERKILVCSLREESINFGTSSVPLLFYALLNSQYVEQHLPCRYASYTLKTTVYETFSEASKMADVLSLRVNV